MVCQRQIEYWNLLYFNKFNFLIPVCFCLVPLALWLCLFMAQNVRLGTVPSPVPRMASWMQTSRKGHLRTTMTHNYIMLFQYLWSYDHFSSWGQFFMRKMGTTNFTLQSFRGVEHRSAALCLGDQLRQNFFSRRPTSLWHRMTSTISFPTYSQDIVKRYEPTNGPKKGTLKTLSLKIWW